MPDIFFCTAFRRDAFPGRRWLTVLPGISSGGSILSSGFPVFFFRAHAAAGGTGSAPGFRFRGSVKAVAHWQTPARFIAAGIFPVNRQKPRNCLRHPPRPLRTGQRYFLCRRIPVPVRRTTALAGTFSSVVQKARHTICVPVSVRYVPAGLSVPAGCS